MALELRWDERARATRDLDFALPTIGDADARVLLSTALANDVSSDEFVFSVAAARSLPDDDAGRPGWRCAVEASLAGRRFERVTVDVVVRPDEVERTERVTISTSLAFAGIGPLTVEMVERTQHFAEKLHALTRTYPNRPNTRVKDLVDLVLLIDDGLSPDATLRSVTESTFVSRNTHALPVEIPDPPTGWNEAYRLLAKDFDAGVSTIEEAMSMLREFWAEVLRASEPLRR